MKQIIKNSYIKTFKFESTSEANTFANNQKAEKILFIDDSFGENHFCYINYHSLTKEKLFVLVFSTDDDEDNLNFLIWNNLFILDTARSIYLVDENLNIKKVFEITTPLIGLYVISNEKLLILEEAYVRVINSNGDLVKSELFDLIEDFSIKDDLLSIQTSEGNRVIKLSSCSNM